MSETYVIIKDNIVVECISVNSIDDLSELYTEHLILPRTGEENIGWKYNGTSFTPPVGE